MGKDGRNSLRRTATLTKEQATELERIAQRDGVSVSWLLRKGVELLIERANEGPLLPGLLGGPHEPH
ncbi:MAG: ribbon-helix-helix domain-containing protein [Methylobacteriaceae bacterium]|nr:ribbon-helix-helix domain-containing protein [Methylobacteriaceae bacterium]